MRKIKPAATRAAVLNQKRHTEIDWNRFAVDVINYRTRKKKSQDDLALSLCLTHNAVFRAERAGVVGAAVFAVLCFVMGKKATSYLKFPAGKKVAK